MTIEWNSVITLKDWGELLEKLIGEAKDAISKNNSRKRLEIQRALVEYAKQSPTFCNALDEISLKIVHSLFLSQVDDCLSALNSHENELKKILEVIQNATIHAKKSEKEIQFISVIDILKKSKSALDTLLDLEKKLQAPDQTLIQKIEEIQISIDSLIEIGNS